MASPNAIDAQHLSEGTKKVKTLRPLSKVKTKPKRSEADKRQAMYGVDK